MQKNNTRFFKFPTLETPRLALRELQLAHQQDVFQVFSDPAVTRYYDVETMTKVKSAQALILWWQKRIKAGKALRWGISLKPGQQIIGTCGFSELDELNHLGEIGCELAQAYWGQGIMPEALQAVIQFGFEQIGLNRIETWIMTENLASIRVFNKLGFKEEGLLRARQYWNNRYQDVMMFSVLRAEWQQPGTVNREQG